MIPPNDWEIKKCLRLTSAILLSMFGLIGLGALGFDIPILRGAVGFVFLTFLPGALILRILRIHNVGMVESLLYSAALSVAFGYFAGLFANFALPLASISRPISLLPVITLLSVFILILGAAAYKRDKNFSPPPDQFGIEGALLPSYLFLLLLPLLAILGTQLVNAYQNNVVLLLLLGLIACVAGLASLGKLPEKVYPMAIFTISVSGAFFASLASPQLWTHDIHLQYYFQHIVLEKGYWNFTIPHNYNSCLSLVIMYPFYALITGVGELWVFKAIFPLVKPLTFMALFTIFRYQMEVKKAFLAVFFFIAAPGGFIGYDNSPGREAFAKFFIILLVLLMVDKKLSNFQKSVLAIIFCISLIFTHYSSAYICMAFLGVGWLLLQLIKQPKISFIWQKLSRQTFLPASTGYNPLIMRVSHYSILNLNLVFLLFIVGITWYMNVTGASAFTSIVNVGNTVYNSLIDFYDPTMREPAALAGLGAGFFRANSLSKVFRILQYITEVLIVAGFLAMLLRPQWLRFQIEFITLSIGAALFLFSSIFLPGFSGHLGFRRIYSFALLFMAPFFVLGAEVIWDGISRFFGLIFKRKFFKEGWLSANADNTSNCLRVLTFVILMPYFLFTSGFAPTVCGSYCESQALNSASVVLGPYKMDRWVFNEQEINAANRLWENLPDDVITYADLYGATLLRQRLYGKAFSIQSSGDTPENAYIFLRTWNIEHNEMVVALAYAFGVHVNLINRPELSKKIKNREIIYDNGGARILAPQDSKKII